MESICATHEMDIFRKTLMETFKADSTVRHLRSGSYRACYTVDVDSSKWVVKHSNCTKVLALCRQITAIVEFWGLPGVQKIIRAYPQTLEILTEYAGNTFSSMLNDCKTLHPTVSLKLKLSVIKQVDTTLSNIQAHHWTRIDLKMDNLYVQRNGHDHVKTTMNDFGLAR